MLSIGLPPPIRTPTPSFRATSRSAIRIAGLHTEVERVARGLLALGVEPGDRVGIWSPNCAEWLILQYAAAKVGAILVNVNPAYRLRELEYALRQSGVSVLIPARRFRNTDYVAMLTELAAGAAHVGRAAAERREASGAAHGRVPRPGWRARRAVVDDRSRRGDGVPGSALLERESPLQFDSRSTSSTRRARPARRRGRRSRITTSSTTATSSASASRYTPRDRVCLPVPFYHCFGCVLGNLAALTHGSAIVLPAESFEAEACLRTVQDERCTALYGVPTMFIAQLEHPSFGSYRLDSLRTGIMAGAPCPIEIMRQVIDRMHMPEVTICYGMTETSPVSFQSRWTTTRDAGRDDRADPSSPRMQDRRSRDGSVVPAGEPGELCTRGYSVMLGYWNDRRRDRQPRSTRRAGCTPAISR